MNKYEVTVVIPAYNSEKYISRCIESLVCQRDISLQIIVVNDGSTDTTKLICEEYEKKYDNFILLNKKNEGQGIARNFGMKYAEGEYVGFVDSDDYVNQGMYYHLYNQAKKYSSDWVYSYTEGESYLDATELEAINDGVLISTPTQKQYMKELFLGGLPNEELDSFLGISVWRSIFSMEIIKKHKIEFVSERKVNSEDLLFNLDFLKYANIVCTYNGAFYNYMHDNSFSFSVRPNENRYKMFKMLYREMSDRLDNSLQLIRIQRRFLANLRITMVEYARWCTFNNYFETRKKMQDILGDSMVIEILQSYPIKKLPFMQCIYFYLMKHKWCLMLVLFAKIRYKIL